VAPLSASEWSQWLDFDKQHIEEVPEASGVWVSHANMKILRIEGSENLRVALKEMLEDDCCGKSKRFRYMLTSSYWEQQQSLLKEYSEKHSGRMPECM